MIERSYLLPDELLEMGKDLKIKHSVSSHPTKYGGTFFIKKLCIGEQTFLGKFFWDVFMGTNDQIMQGGKLMLKRFQRLSQVSFSSH